MRKSFVRSLILSLNICKHCLFHNNIVSYYVLIVKELDKIDYSTVLCSINRLATFDATEQSRMLQYSLSSVNLIDGKNDIISIKLC